MPDYSKPLGDGVKRARKRLDLTQNEVADSIDVDVRTIINIENYKGNPKLEVLYPLIRSLKIDPREIFYPEMQRESPALRQLRLLVEDCSEEEAATIIPVLQSVVAALRDKNATPIT
jgi:DNA-binding XRE family transcriptional regulator